MSLLVSQWVEARVNPDPHPWAGALDQDALVLALASPPPSEAGVVIAAARATTRTGAVIGVWPRDAPTRATICQDCPAPG